MTPESPQPRIPLDPAALEGPVWLRGRTPGASEGERQPAQAGHLEELVRPSPHDALRAAAIHAVVDIDAAIASLEAMRAHLLAGLGGMAVESAHDERLDSAVAVRDLACELALRQRRSDRAVEAEVAQAMSRRDRWPGTVAAWGEARIHSGHVRVICEVGAALQEPGARAAFEAALLPHAETTTPGRLRTLARRELDRHLAEPLAERHRTARELRGVTITDLDDGMSMVRAIVPTLLAHGIRDRLTQLARAADGDDPRGIDERRADALCDLLLTGEPAAAAIEGIRAEVSIVMPASVLTGNGAEDVARLASGAPVDPETARALAADATAWIRLFTDPLRGHVVATDAYVPGTRLRRLLRQRDQRCRWPGCCAQASRSDLDHTIPWIDGGTTTTDNLAHLCRRHHVLKGAALAGARRWKVRQTSPGVLEFRSPMGERYVDEPPAVGPRFREPPEWGLPLGVAAPQGDQPF